MKEVVTVHVGQCGNQVGRCFWDLVLKEHASHQEQKQAKAMNRRMRLKAQIEEKDNVETGLLFDASMRSFLRNVDTRKTPPADLDFNGGKTPVYALRARAVLVDTEQGVINETMRKCGPLGELFDEHQTLYGVSGAGNNFAHGYAGYGPTYHDELLQRFRRAAEQSDSLLGFFITHSLGGGTGSGLGTYILSMLHDEFPDVMRFSAPVLPTPEDDDVITSPYNAVLATQQLVEHADFVFPAENQALLGICAQVEKYKAFSAAGGAGSVTSRLAKMGHRSAIGREKPFDQMNNIIAHMLANLTSSCRFSGRLNCDLSDLGSSLVPFRGMHFITTGLSPLFSLADIGKRESLLRTDQMFRAAFSRKNQLMRCTDASQRYLAGALLARGNVRLGDVESAIDKANITMPNWSGRKNGGWKVGLCKVSPIGSENAVLCLANSTGIRVPLSKMARAFTRLYKRRAHVHHFTEYVELEDMEEALHRVRALRDDYHEMGQPRTTYQYSSASASLSSSLSSSPYEHDD